MRINYLEGNRAIELANKIFGFNGWSTRIVDLQVDFCDEVNGRVSLGVSCTTRVTLKDGTYKEVLILFYFIYLKIDRIKRGRMLDMDLLSIAKPRGTLIRKLRRRP